MSVNQDEAVKTERRSANAQDIPSAPPHNQNMNEETNNAGNETLSDEEEQQQYANPDESVRVIIDEAAKEMGIGPIKPNRDYAYGNLPINYEMELKHQADAAVADAFVAAAELFREENPAKRELLFKALTEGAIAAKQISIHHGNVSDELRRVHNPPTLARKPRIGKKDTPPNIKPGYFPKYSGTPDQDTFAYLNWVDQIFSYLEGYTSKIHLDVLTRHAGGAVLQTIHMWRNQQKDNIEEIMAFIEKSVAGVVSPEIAENLLNRLTIGPGESIGSIASIIHMYSMMIHINDPEHERPKLESTTAKRHLLRILPPSITLQFNNLVKATRVGGKLAMSFKETVKLLMELHQDKVDAQENHKTFNMRSRGQHQGEAFLISGGRRPVFRRYGKFKTRPIKKDPRTHQKHQIWMCEEGDEDEVEQPPVEDELVEAEEGYDSSQDEEEGEIFNIQRQVRLSASHFGVAPNACYKCGRSNHKYSGPDATNCPLYKHKLQLKVCPRCNNGGHSEQVCPNQKN